MSRIPEAQKSLAKKADEDEEEEDSDDELEGPTLKKQFLTFVKFRDEKNPGTHIKLSQSDFWMKHAGVIKGRTLTTTDTGICYFRFKKYQLSYNEYLEFLQNLADYKNIPVDEIIEKMVNCGPPAEGVEKNLSASKIKMEERKSVSSQTKDIDHQETLH